MTEKELTDIERPAKQYARDHPRQVLPTANKDIIDLCDALRSARKWLKKNGEHLHWCRLSVRRKSIPCNCGLDAAMKGDEDDETDQP